MDGGITGLTAGAAVEFNCDFTAATPVTADLRYDDYTEIAITCFVRDDAGTPEVTVVAAAALCMSPMAPRWLMCT